LNSLVIWPYRRGGAACKNNFLFHTCKSNTILTFVRYFMEYLLHIDTSTDKGTIAISGNGNLLAYQTNEETRNHAAAINSMIESVLKHMNISLNDLSAIVACGGPGSYTGLRIGIATAKGLCFALDKPLILDNRLTLLAYHAWRKHKNEYQRYISILVARASELFISIHDNKFTSLLAPQHIMEDQLKAILEEHRNGYFITNTSGNVINKPENDDCYVDHNIEIDLNSWAFFAYEKYLSHDIVNLANAEPFYLKQVYTHN
jgi:tRNA threonylcarbamoyladenosine biosynthesis protein TsaB